MGISNRRVPAVFFGYYVFVYFVDMCNALCIVILTKNFCAKLGFLHFCQYIISYCSEFSLFCILCQEFWEESTSSRGGLGSGVVGVPDSRPTLDGAVLHDFTIGLFDMRSLCWITCIF